MARVGLPEFDFSVDGDTLSDLVADVVLPYALGDVFVDRREHYQRVEGRFYKFFEAFHDGTRDHLGEEEIDIAYNEVFDMLRFREASKIPLICKSIELWYDRTDRRNSYLAEVN